EDLKFANSGGGAEEDGHPSERYGIDNRGGCGGARNVLCEAVERHKPSMLVSGSYGYGAMKRAVLGSVSDYCAHHACCTVIIVKRPKIKN
ncbi:Adenine nucleotide alpha hydrolases-like superfamily protein, partial [Prunus dulcis]